MGRGWSPVMFADWYSPIIQHGEVDFRDQRRDQRECPGLANTAKGRPLLSKAELYELEAYLNWFGPPKSKIDWVRLLAKQTLKTKEASPVYKCPGQWLGTSFAGDRLTERTHRLEALWTVHDLEPNRHRLTDLYEIEQPAGARSAAVRVLYYWNEKSAGCPCLT